MAKNNNNTKYKSKTIALRALTDLAGVNYFTLYRRKVGMYKSDMDPNTKTKLANALVKDIEPFMKDLGFKVRISPIL